MTKIVAIVLAAGKGVRMNNRIPKPYITIKGKPVLAYALHPFQLCDNIEEIIIAVPEGQADQCRESVLEPYQFTKVKQIINGGKERQDSIYNSLKCVPDDTEMVMVHDGARAFVTRALLQEGIMECKKHDVVIPVLPVHDTIKKVTNGFVTETVPRDNLVAVQTPQFFKFELLMNAYTTAYKESFYGTDDAMLAERVGAKVHIIQGEQDNIKLTTQSDLRTAESIIEKRGL